MDSLVNFRSHKTQLLATAVAASATTAGAVLAYQALSRKRRRRDLSADVLASISNSDAAKAAHTLLEPTSATQETTPTLPVDSDQYAYDEGLIREQLARNYAFFGAALVRACPVLLLNIIQVKRAWKKSGRALLQL